MTDLDGEIRGGRHGMRVRVYYEDTDFSGAVYHASYLRFMERGRTNYLRILGADQNALFDAGGAFMVRAMQLEFLRSARMDDILEVVTTPAEVKGASVILHQQVRRADETLLDARVKVVFVFAGRPRPIPKSLRAAMHAHRLQAPA